MMPGMITCHIRKAVGSSNKDPRFGSHCKQAAVTAGTAGKDDEVWVLDDPGLNRIHSTKQMLGRQ